MQWPSLKHSSCEQCAHQVGVVLFQCSSSAAAGTPLLQHTLRRSVLIVTILLNSPGFAMHPCIAVELLRNIAVERDNLSMPCTRSLQSNANNQDRFIVAPIFSFFRAHRARSLYTKTIRPVAFLFTGPCFTTKCITWLRHATYMTTHVLPSRPTLIHRFLISPHRHTCEVANTPFVAGYDNGPSFCFTCLPHANAPLAHAETTLSPPYMYAHHYEFEP